MWALILSPIGRKLSIGLIVGLTLFVGYRHVLNVGKNIGRQEASVEMTKAKEAEWAKKDSQIEAALAQISEQQKLVSAQQEQIVKERLALRDSITTSDARFTTQKEIIREKIDAISEEALPMVLDVAVEEVGGTRAAINALTLVPVLETEIESLRQQREDLQLLWEREREVFQAEVANLASRLDSTKMALRLAEEQREHYKLAFEVATRRPRGIFGKIGCGLRAGVTIGLSRCK